MESRLTRELVSYSAIRKEVATGGLLSFQDVYKKRDILGDIEKRLRSQKDFSKLITYLFEQAMFTRIEIKDVNYSFDENKEIQVSKLTLRLNIEGDYEDLRRFIYNMESGSHLFRVDSVKITRGQEKVAASITLISYLKTS